MSGTDQRLDAILMLIERQGDQQDQLHDDFKDMREQIAEVQLLGEKRHMLVEKFASDLQEIGVRINTIEVKAKDTAEILNHLVSSASGGALAVPSDITTKQSIGLAVGGFMMMGLAVKVAETVFLLSWQFLAKTVLPFVVKVLERAAQG